MAESSHTQSPWLIVFVGALAGALVCQLYVTEQMRAELRSAQLQVNDLRNTAIVAQRDAQTAQRDAQQAKTEQVPQV